MKLWNSDAERGTVLGMIAGLLFLALTGSSDADLSVVHQQNNTPYGVLWTWLNPLYWTNLPYLIGLFVIYAVIFKVQCVFVKRGRLNKNLVWMNLFSVLFLFVIHAQQNVTIIMLGPFVALSPLVLIPIMLQKLPIGWSLNFQDPHWNCAFNGSSNATDWYQPCLSNSVHLNIFHIYSLSYLVILFWVIFPLLLWLKAWRHKRMIVGKVEQRKKALIAAVLEEMFRDAQEQEIAEGLGSFWNMIEEPDKYRRRSSDDDYNVPYGAM